MEISKKLLEMLQKEYKEEKNIICGCEEISFEDFVKFRIVELEKEETK
ncbi:hypothetical protein STFE110948_07070 [Streptobacillus felis]|uniref:Uncharacterized protein n=1 Tax=Streptobacillus felis TaxID=1384509 RepID=A0A7Z0T8Y6_9FUSO|nr:hypothetical protein [Streptobacillus felis]NYV28414.1 hypothetical protein [Streptobacillus felis]